MRSRAFLAGLFFVFALFVEVADAQTGSGTLSITANVQSSIKLTFLTDASGMAVTGTTTSTASLPMGNVSMNSGTVPANVTKTLNGAVSFNLSTPFDILVNLANSSSTTYTLSAMLTAADAVNVWTIGATDISSGASFALASAGVYGTAVPYTFKLTLPATAIGSVSNTIVFTAVAN
jgi:subtilase family serine protease